MSESETYYCEVCDTDGFDRDEVVDNTEWWTCLACYDREVDAIYAAYQDGHSIYARFFTE